jgi:crossover junction endodeoxyribonuclease RuvC
MGMVIFGIDPGLASTGFGAIDCTGRNPVLARCGYIRTSPADQMASRLYQIHSDMALLIDAVKPDLVAVENIFSLVRYPKAGIVLGGVLGIIYLSVFQNNLPMMEISPKEAKNALVGYGGASKDQIRRAVQNLLKIEDIESFHAADALAVALTAFYRKGPGGNL